MILPIKWFIIKRLYLKKESLSFIYILHMICGGLMKVVLVYYIHYQTKENEKRNEDNRVGEDIGLYLQRILYC